MVHVTGTVHDVSDNPDRVERIVVRAAEPRMHDTTYITEESAQFPVVDGVLDFNVLPGLCVVAFLRNHGATTYAKLLVPDAAEATFKECLEAGNLAEEGDRSALEKVVRQIQDELAKAAPLVEEVRTLSTEVRNDRTAVDGFTKAAQKSASEAATSESNAKGHETAAGDYAAVATTAATEAVDAMGRVTEVVDADYATRDYVSTAVADAVADAVRVDTTAGTAVFVGDTLIFGDTGTRVLTSWDKEGNITYGTIPEGISPMPDKSGGIYIRRVGQRVTWSIICAVATLAAPSVPIPDGFRVDHAPYPYTNFNPVKSSGPVIANVGSTRLFLAGLTVGENMTNTSGSYGSNVVWDCTQSWPTSLPGIPR